MKVKALVPFAGIVNMSAGEVKDIDNRLVVEDLLAAGYVEPAEEIVEPAKADDEKTAKKGKKQI